MTDLSPQAQAVYDAATTEAIIYNADWPVIIAAALRAAAAQVVPHEYLTEADLKVHERQLMRLRLLGIAEELEQLDD